MPGPSYKHFTDVYDYPYTIVAILYIVAQIFFTFAMTIRLCVWLRKRKYAGALAQKRCCQKLSEWIELFNSWLIRLIFGKSEGVSEEDLQVQNGSKIYINRKKLETMDIHILGVIILIFGLLVAINAYGTYLLEVTHTCSDDTNIYCYPLLINPDNLELVVRKDVLLEPIKDCAEWTNSSIAPYVSFQCFRYALNANAALAVAGGLLALFTIVMRTTISIITKIFQKCKLYKYEVPITVVQVLFAMVLLVLHVTGTLIVIGFQLLDSLGLVDSEVDQQAQQIAASIADNGIQLVVAVGTIILLLLIPWAHYTKTTPETNSQAAASSQADSAV